MSFWNREDLIWAAGLFEGEGSIYKTKRGEWAMGVNMTDEDVLRRYHAAVKFGYINGPYFVSEYKPKWEWKCTKKKHIYAICAALWPFMGERRQVKMTEALLDLPNGLKVF